MLDQLTLFCLCSSSDSLTPTRFFFFFTPPLRAALYTLSLHDALPILTARSDMRIYLISEKRFLVYFILCVFQSVKRPSNTDRKSTRLNSSHVAISYAVFCLKKTNRNCEPGKQRPRVR